MIKNKKTIIFLTLTLVFVFAVTASGFFGFFQSDEEEEVKTLSIWTRDYSADLLEESVEMFNEKDNDIEIEITSFPIENFSDQFSAALSAGSEPDIVSLDLVLAPYYSSVGAFSDISDKFESLEYKDELIDSMLHLGQYEGAQYAVPFNADVSALIYNRDHFKEAGLDPDEPPVTWDELREYADELTTEDRYGYVYAGGDPGGHMFTVMPYVWGNGGRVLNEDGTESLLNSDEAIEALEMFTDLTLADESTPSGVASYGWEQYEEAFTSGKASMMVNGNFIIPELNDNHPDKDYGVALIPKNEGGEHASFAGGEVIAITDGTDYKEEAWEFIEFSMSEEIQIETWAKNGIMPVREDFFANEYFEAEERYQVFAESLAFSHSPYSERYNEMYDPILSAMQNALMGEITPEEAFYDAEEEINDIIQR